MATQVALTIRRNEAHARIAQAVQALAKAQGVKLDDSLDARHRDPQIEEIARLEALADALNGLAKPKPKASPVPTDSVEQQLEAETGHEVVQTAKEPPVFVETDKPVSKGKTK